MQYGHDPGLGQWVPLHMNGWARGPDAAIVAGTAMYTNHPRTRVYDRFNGEP